MDIKFKYQKIFADLFASEDGIFAYKLHCDYDITPSEAVEFIKKYEKKGIISVSEDFKLSLTAEGRNDIVKTTHELQLERRRSMISIQCVQTNEKLGLFDPYLPNENFITKIQGEKIRKETSK